MAQTNWTTQNLITEAALSGSKEMLEFCGRVMTEDEKPVESIDVEQMLDEVQFSGEMDWSW